MADPMMPDLTGLSEEERKIIEEVLARQRAEEQKEEQINTAADKELDDIERQINQRKETAARLVGTQDDAICQICQKTKFADGIGHKCFYCQLRSCARCGGRTTSKNKNIWACSMCQKRQQILARTGKWFQNATDQKGGTGSGSSSQQDLASQQYPTTPNEGNYQPSMVQQGSTGQMQQMQGQQNQNGPMQSSNMGNGHVQHAPPQQQAQQPPPVQQAPPPTQKESVVGGLMGMIGLKPSNPAPVQVQPAQAQAAPPVQQHHQQQQQHQQSRPIAPLNGASQHAGTAVNRRQHSLHRQSSLTDRDREFVDHPPTNGQNGQQQRKSSRYDDPETSRRYEDEQRSRQRNRDRINDPPYVDSPRGSIRSGRDDHYYDEPTSSSRPRGPGHPPQRKPSESRRRDDNQQIYDDDPSFRRDGSRRSRDIHPPPVDHPSGQQRPNGINHPRRGTRSNSRTALERERSVDRSQPTCPPAVPPPEKPIGFSTPTTLKPLPGMQARHRKLKLQARSASTKEATSSEEEAPQGNTEQEKNDFTEKDLLLYIYGSSKAKMGPEMAKFEMSLKSKSNLDLATSARSAVMPGNSLAAKIRRYLLSPVSWQPSADQRHLIGHMVLQRLQNDHGDLGLKVAGGRHTASGRLGAFVTKVRPQSVADVVGQLRPGDEVVEWNGRNLQNATPEHVRQIVASSKNDPQVELIVSRSMTMPGGDDFLNIRRPATGLADYSDYGYVNAPAPMAPQNPMMVDQPKTYTPTGLEVGGAYGGIPRIRHISADPRPKYSVPGMPFSMSQQVLRQHSPHNLHALANQARAMGPQTQIFGQIEISLLYLPQDRELTVTVICASDLPPRRDGTYRNPYVKLFLLPDRSEKSLRQTTVHAETLSPAWNEPFYYRNLTEPALMSRVLEVTVWDYDKYEANTFLGEVLIDFSTAILDNQPFAYTLVEMDDDNPVRLRLRNRRMSTNTPPLRPYSEMAQYPGYGYRSNRGPAPGNPIPYPYNDEIEDPYAPVPSTSGAMSERIPRSQTYDRSGGPAPAPIATGGISRNSCHCGGTADWNINSVPEGLRNGGVNGYVAPGDYMAEGQRGYYSRRPHSATAIRKNEDMMYQQAAPLPGGATPRAYRGRANGAPHPRNRHSHDPAYRLMSPLTSPYGNDDQQMGSKSARSIPQPGYYDDPQQMQIPNQQIALQQQMQQPPSLPPHMQSYGAPGEYGSDGSETMSVHSAQSMQNRQISRQLPASSEDGECSSTSLRHQNYVNDEYGQNMSMEEAANQSDATTKSGTAAIKEMKERKKSLMTRLIPGRVAGGQMEKRTGFARSEEVGIPESLAIPGSERFGANNFQKQASKESTDSDNWHQAATTSGGVLGDAQLGTFVENLGAGQVVGRQVLASPVLGEIELIIDLAKSGIYVTVRRAKNLTIRPGVKTTPAPYVKMQLVNIGEKQGFIKAKTAPARKTTAPVFDQIIEFNESFKHRLLQVTVLGDCGRLDRKLFMGVAQIRLDDVATMQQPVTSWYKLFHNSSLSGVATRKDSNPYGPPQDMGQMGQPSM